MTFFFLTSHFGQKALVFLEKPASRQTEDTEATGEAQLLQQLRLDFGHEGNTTLSSISSFLTCQDAG